jgi:glycosyltransferase involved in cell wall biosynthesis
MKVLFDHPLPFLLAHGGFQIQLEQTKAALERIGVEVEFLRWWDDRQHGDLIHFFGAASNSYLERARAMKLPVIMHSFLSETCNRPDARLARQGWLTRVILAMPFGEGMKQQLTWRAYRNCTHNVVGIEAERCALQIVHRVPADRISVVPLGLSEVYLRAGRGLRNESHLIYTGTIRPVKHCTEVAEMARAAQVPVLFVGKPYHPGDPYWLHFKTLIDDRWVKYHPHVSDEKEMIALLQAARGFVLMSDYENWSLSAHEAAACGLPLLLQDQKWSRERFGDQARYFERIGISEKNIESLRRFHADAPNLPPPAIRLYSWDEVAEQLRTIYERVLSTSP